MDTKLDKICQQRLVTRIRWCELKQEHSKQPVVLNH